MRRKEGELVKAEEKMGDGMPQAGDGWRENLVETDRGIRELLGATRRVAVRGMKPEAASAAALCMKTISFSVGEESAGQRLDDFLAARFVRLSRMRIAGLVERGGCAVNGAAGRAGQRLNAGDLVEAAAPEETPNAMT